MTTNQELAHALRAIADLLDLQGERFKPEAYRRAARSIEALPEDIRAIAARGGLDEIPGVGAAIAEKSKEFLRDGTIPYLERLRAEIPAGLVEIMRLPGLGPKTARRLLVEFAIQSPSELAAAIDAGRLTGAKGVGAKKLAQWRAAAAAPPPSAARTPLLVAWRLARRLVDGLRAAAPVDRLEIAGSLRRRRETIGDLDILATSAEPEAVFDAFTHLPGIATVRLRGPTKETVVLDVGVQVDLRVVEPAAFGAALQYFTGSKEHNVRTRTLAKDRGLRINEYGVYRDETRIAGSTEEEVYAQLGFPWIPPEIREDHGEIEAAAAGTVPDLVEARHLAGDLHVHVAPDEIEALDGLRSAARRLGASVLGIVPPTGSLDAFRAAIADRSASTPAAAGLRLGVELPIAAASSVPDGVDYWLALGPQPAALPQGAISPLAGVHLDLSAGPAAFGAWAAWAREVGAALELSPRPGADGLDAAQAKTVVDAGGSVHLTAGRRTADDDLDAIELAVGLARRAWTPPERVINRRDPTSRPPPATPGRRRTASPG